MALPRLTVFRELWDAIREDKEIEAPALPESTLPVLLAGLPMPASGRPVVVVLHDRPATSLPTLARAMAFWQQAKIAGEGEHPLPRTILATLLPQERMGDIPTARLRAYWQALTSLKDRTPRLILTTSLAAQQPAPRLASDLGALALAERHTLSPTLLAERLVGMGYTEERDAEEPGTFARRGGIVDIAPFHADARLRIEFSGNAIDRVRPLRARNRNGADAERLFARVAETADRVWNVYPLALPHSLPTTFDRILNAGIVMAEEGTLPPKVSPDILLRPFSPSRALTEAPAHSGDTEALRKDIRRSLDDGHRVIVFTARPGALRSSLPTHERLTIVPADTATDARGFTDHADRVTVRTDADIGESAEEEPLTWERGMAYARRFTEGGVVVHRDHGIGRFRGIERKELYGSARDYLILEYAASDRLLVPAELSHKVTPYIGAANPVIHRLGGSEWESTTRGVRREAAALAKELLELYAAREVETGTAYPPETEEERALATSFSYALTHDQAAAIREVTKDMERARPMDRLVCGDVGFGKTEVAIRAALKAVTFGRQVAVLAPTTLLAQQHYDTFRERLKAFPTRIVLLSRFQTPAEQTAIVKRLARGEVNIVIGTHRLLSDDVAFAALGLLIIDEEQKFGVEQKERLKNLRASVDVLSLSATPIPRTLHMSLSGLRSLSVIATAPGGRRPVITKVVRENDALIQRALAAELERHGQAYILWNRVETIETAAERIRKLLPAARVVVGHGQMPEVELMRVMEAFDTRRADILVCSTIIQNGIDLPNVNTLIVFDAPSFGLSDLYQLRGRVGRGDTQAYAYFLYRHGRLPFEARKRLTALLEAVELGSGWTLALRDLEIRGAGNLLGKEQHGTIRAVGVHLFSDLLAEEVERVRTGRVARASAADVHVDLPVSAYLPESYVPNTADRLSAYTRAGSARTPADLTAARRAIEERYGPLPTPAAAFFKIVHMKLLAASARVSAVVVRDQPMSAKRDTSEKEPRLTLTLQDGLTPALAYAAISDNPQWTFTGSTMSMRAPAGENALLRGIEHTLRLLADARDGERRTGGRARKNSARR